MVNMMGGSSSRKRSELDNLLKLISDPAKTQELIERHDQSRDAHAKAADANRASKQEADAAIQTLKTKESALDERERNLADRSAWLEELKTQLHRKHQEADAASEIVRRDRAEIASELLKQKELTAEVMRKLTELERHRAELEVRERVIAEREGKLRAATDYLRH